MVNGVTAAAGLSFPRETFAKLTPGPFLKAHLKQPNPIRPSGRLPSEFRKPTVNVGSLTHSNGSAVVRCGDTAVVCGVRAEILLSSAIPHSPSEDLSDSDVIEELGLLVPNLEMSTGCSPAHLPGNPPGSLAQSLSYRILSLLYDSKIIDPRHLKIQYTQPKTDEDVPDEGPKVVTIGYWTLYIDILCIALDGNVFDAAWAAIVAAFQNTIIPKAWWDPDREMILCSPRTAEANKLQLSSLPISSTFAIFSTASPLKQRDDAERWMLADPDSFEEDLACETLTVIVDPGNDGKGLLRIQKNGGADFNSDLVSECVRMAQARHAEMVAAVEAG